MQRIETYCYLDGEEGYKIIIRTLLLKFFYWTIIYTSDNLIFKGLLAHPPPCFTIAVLWYHSFMFMEKLVNHKASSYSQGWSDKQRGEGAVLNPS